MHLADTGNTGHTNHGSNGSSRRKSSQLLGRTIFLDDEVVWRINWMQRGMSVCLCVAILCYVLGNDERSPVLQFATILFCGMGLLCFAFLCYRNISFMVMKKVTERAKCVNYCCTDYFKFIHGDCLSFPIFRYIWTGVYATAYKLPGLDAVVYKSWKQYFAWVPYPLNIYNMYGNTFGKLNADVVLLEYDIQGYKYRIMGNKSIHVFSDFAVFCEWCVHNVCR